MVTCNFLGKTKQSVLQRNASNCTGLHLALSTNLGVGSSNLPRCANEINRLSNSYVPQIELGGTHSELSGLDARPDVRALNPACKSSNRDLCDSRKLSRSSANSHLATLRFPCFTNSMLSASAISSCCFRPVS